MAGDPVAAPQLSRDVLSELGKMLVASGIALSFPAIWLTFGDAQSYWSQTGVGHSLGIGMVVLASVCAVLLLASVIRPRPALATAFSIPGLVLGGLLLYVPLQFAFTHHELLKAGGWIGFAAFVAFAVGAILTALAAPSASRPRGGTSLVARAVAWLGVVLAFPAIWVHFAGNVSYWRIPFFGHSLGIGLLVLAIVCAVLLLLSELRLHSTFDRLFPVPGLVAGGLLLFVPLEAAFDHLGDLGAGAWLGFVACLAIVVASVLMILSPRLLTVRLPARRVKPKPEPAPSPPQASPEPGPAHSYSPPSGPPVQTVSAGWYADPSGQARLRYWDGERWTDQTQQ